MASASKSTASASATADRRMIVRPMRVVGLCAWGVVRGEGAAMGRTEAKKGEVRRMRLKLRLANINIGRFVW